MRRTFDMANPGWTGPSRWLMLTIAVLAACTEGDPSDARSSEIGPLDRRSVVLAAQAGVMGTSEVASSGARSFSGNATVVFGFQLEVGATVRSARLNYIVLPPVPAPDPNFVAIARIRSHAMAQTTWLFEGSYPFTPGYNSFEVDFLDFKLQPDDAFSVSMRVPPYIFVTHAEVVSAAP